ncbi:DMT family transporter [Marivivens marinus]|uniref:DMT family transporter n=1 Tax=Marivivens marinus TaxID=3110173 RepID=UPI003B8493A4
MKALSPNISGALLMMLSMAAFTVNDTFMKAAAAHVPFYQAITLRGVGISIGLITLALWRGQLRVNLPRRDWGRIGLRTAAEIVGTLLFLTALVHMPLANLSAILQSLPLTVTLAAAIFLGEPVGWRRMTAIGVGFLGVLLIVRPGTEGFTIYSVLGVGAVLAVTVRDLAARRLSAGVPSLMVAVVAALGVTAFGIIGGLSEDWVPVDGAGGLMLGGAALCLMVGYVASVSAMRIGEIAIVAPFRYSSLLVALVLGFLVFGDWPAWPTLLGAAILVGTGLYTFHRERRIARRNARAAA